MSHDNHEARVADSQYRQPLATAAANQLPRPPQTWIIGEIVHMLMDSWAGRTRHAARIQRLCPKRAKVFWLDCSRRHGTSSYVPYAAIAKAEMTG